MQWDNRRQFFMHIISWIEKKALEGSTKESP